MSTSLKCKNCGSRNTAIIKKRDLEEFLDKKLVGDYGYFDPTVVIRLIEAIARAIIAIFEYLTEKARGKRKVVVCKDCGYWQEI